MTHICVGLTTIGSYNGSTPHRRSAIIWTNVGTLLIWTLGKKYWWTLNRDSYISIHENASQTIACEMTGILSRPQCVKAICTVLCHDMQISRPDQQVAGFLIRSAPRACIVIGIDTNVEVIVGSLITWEAHQTPRSKGYVPSNKHVLSSRCIIPSLTVPEM